MGDQAGNPDFRNGIPELLVLKILQDEELYGYRIVQQIKQRSGEKLEVSDGCVYPLLHKLEAEGYLESRDQTVDGRERLYYRLTDSGEGRLQNLADEWSDVVEGVLGVWGEEDPRIPLQPSTG